ncbi:MAG: msrB [Solirubrobacterales bacterium]|jgi:peptide-methionine (R)-S-oxide reductase|nr:msrB [Solirubrobacterales bacterium]
MTQKIEKSDAEWRAELSPTAYEVLRKGATERPFTNDHMETVDGVYRCGGCKTPLFTKDTKFESGSGWPSFTEAIDSGAVELKEDRSLSMKRVEVLCNTCGGHLGHVFDDGPADRGGQRYCINAAALDGGTEG